MKVIFNIILLLILFFISFSNETPIELDVTAKSGIINKKIDSSKKDFSFEIECEVNQNITNSITKIDISLEVTKLEDNSQIFDSICHIVPVRLTENNVATTNLLCIIDLTNFKHILTKETNLIIQTGPEASSSNIVTFSFLQFECISQTINIGMKAIEYLEEGYCINNQFIFQMTTTNIDTRPLLSTICTIALSDDDAHKEARCAIPLTGDIILCSIDVSETKYKENDNIIIKEQDPVPCENGQNIQISNYPKTLTIKEECGEIINNKSVYIKFNIFFIFLLLLILL